MSTTPVGMGAQDSAEREKFENEVRRITEAGNKAGLTLRVLGSLAFHMHCPRFGYLQAEMGRAYTDIDFAAYSKQSKEIKAVTYHKLAIQPGPRGLEVRIVFDV